MGSFGTQTNPSHYVEIPDPLNPGQVVRPASGTVLKARAYETGASLPDVTTTDYGYFSTSPSVDIIEVSGDGGVTWVGPLVSAQATVASTTAGADAATATITAGQALTTAQQALNTAQTGVGATWNVNIAGQPSTFPPSPHTHLKSQISDINTFVQGVLNSADMQAFRAAIGAGTGSGTSNLTLGSTSTTAAPGNHVHAASALSFAPTASLPATDVQTAIQQAAATGGTSASELKIVRYVSGAYESLPTTPDAAWKVIEYRGPTAPTPPGTTAYATIQFDWLARGT